MNFLEKKYGPFTGRCWGLFANFVANALAIHGAIGYVLKGQNPLEMYIGLAASVLICLVVAIPSR